MGTKKEARSISLTISKINSNRLKIKYNTQNYKNTRKNHRGDDLRDWCVQRFYDQDFK